jgi:hypothetical protein
MPSGWAMGGPGSLVVKVEIDGWLEGGRIRPPHDYGPAPVGWSPTANTDQRVSWVFDPDNPPSESQYTGPLQPGDYVRLVGTRWEDGPHTSGGVGGCWNEGFTAGRGWIEMHPVDYMARITQVPRTGHGPYDANSWDVLTLCDNASVSGWEVMAPGPRPAPNATFGFERQVIGDFTALAHLNPPLSVSTMLGDRIQVTVGAQNWNDGFLNLVSHRGRFLAFFRVFWNLPPPPPTPTVTLTLPCGEAVQITTDAPAIGPDGAPLAIVFRRGTSSGPGWTDLTSYGINSRTFLDQTFLGQPPPSGTLFYQVCVKDSALQESCGVAAIGISGTDSNEQLCNGVCTNLGSDSANCGGCGVYCPGNCTARQCTCPNGGTMCQNLNLICTDLISDPNNCGRCNNKCPGGHACVDGACASGCPAYAPDLCGGVCVDTTTDSNHCGSCTHRCPSGSYCDDSTCKRGIRQ